MTTTTTISAEQIVTVIIEPCTVTSYTATTSITSMIYKIGEPDLTSFYAFDESPVCNYPEIVTVTNLPAFIVHNEAASSITIPSSLDLNRVGQYTVTVKS